MNRLTVACRRKIARVCIAIDVLGLIAEVILDRSGRSPSWGADFAGVAIFAVGVVAGLLYLRSTRRTAASRHDISKSDCAAWGTGRTLADLGELTAQWLEGTLPSVPGYTGEPDPETEELVPVLAKLNRAGFVTTGSQPAFSGWGYGGAWWEQRAAVEGFTDSPDLVMRIRQGRRAYGLKVIAHDPATLPRWRYRYGRSVTVTTRNGAHCTGFGVQMPRRHIRDSWIGYGICHRDAVDALCGAWQVTVIDPESGRPDALWRVLAEAASPSGGAR